MTPQFAPNKTPVLKSPHNTPYPGGGERRHPRRHLSPGAQKGGRSLEGRIGAKNLRFPGQETTTGHSWPRVISDGGLTGAKLGRAAVAAQRVSSGARFADLHEHPETGARPKRWPTRWNKAPTAPNRTSHNRPKARHRCAPPRTPTPQTERRTQGKPRKEKPNESWQTCPQTPPPPLHRPTH